MYFNALKHGILSTTYMYKSFIPGVWDHCVYGYSSAEFLITSQQSYNRLVERGKLQAYRKHNYNIWVSFREKETSLYIYKSYKNHVTFAIAITSVRYTPLTSYFQHFILHHFSTVKHFLGSCTCSMHVLQRPIPHKV